MPQPPDATLNPRARQEDYNTIYQQVLDEIDSESKNKNKGKKKKRKPDNRLHNWKYYYERPKWKDFEPDDDLAARIESAPPAPPRRFKDCTPGFLMLTLLREAHARGALVEIHANFSKEKDSAGRPWSKKPKDLINHKFKSKTTLLQVANWLADANHAEARMNGRVLELYRPDSGRDHPDVLLARGRNITSLPKKGSHRDLATHVFVQSESGVHGWVGDEKLRKRIGRRVEAGLDTGHAKYWEVVEERGKNYLRRFGQPRHARTVTIVPDRGANPYKQYRVGDTVRLMENNRPTKHRVRQIMLRWETDGSCIPIVVLSHKIVSNAIKQHKKLRSLTGKTGMTSPSLSQLDGTVFESSDGEAPEAPSAPVVTVRNGVAEVYYDGTDDAGATPVWDLSHVELHIGIEENFEPTDLTFHSAMANAGVTTINFPDYDTAYYAKFIAVDRGGDRSAPSEEVVIRVPKVTSDDIQAGAVGSEALDPDLQIGTDGSPPIAAPANVRAVGGNGFIMLLWDAVINQDPVTYNVYGSRNTGFTADAATLLTPDGATSPISFNREADDTPFEYFVPDPITGDPTEDRQLYYFRVEVRDADVPDGTLGPISDEVSGSMDQTQAKDVAFGSITGQHFSGEVIYGGTIGNAAAGAGWRGTAEAFGVYKSDDSAKFFAPTNDEPILVNGQVIAQILDSYKLSVFGEENSFMPGSKTYMRGTTQGPATQPSVTSDNWKTQTLDTDEFKNQKRGFFYDAASDHYFFTVQGFGPGDPISSLNEVDRNGAPISTVLMDTAVEGLGYYTYGITRDAAGRWYVLVRYYESAFYQIFRYDATLSDLTAWELLNPTFEPKRRPAIGYDAENNRLMIAYATTSGTWRIEHRTCPGMLPTGSAVVSNVAYGGGSDLVCVLKGQFDFPDADNYVVVNANAPGSPTNFRVFRSTGVDLPNRYWPIANDAHICGLTWDGNHFYHLSIPSGNANGHIIEYSDMTWTTETDDWYIKNTLWDPDLLGTGVHETVASPPRKINMTKRGMLHVTTGAIPAPTGSPDDPTSVRVYVGRSSSGVPLDANMYLAPDQPGPGETFVKIDQMNFAAADTLATPDPPFPSSSPAEFFDEALQKLLASDGSVGVFYTGDIKPTTRNVPGGGAVVDGGWVKLDNTDVVITAPYDKLWAEWGSPAPAVGALAGTFRLDDTRGRALFGAGTAIPLRSDEGQSNETLRGPGHTHSMGHTHNISNTSHNGLSNTTLSGSGVRVINIGGSLDGSHNHGGNTGGASSTNTGTGLGANERMGAYGVNVLVKL